MRWIRAFSLPLLISLLVLAACGSSASPNADDGDPQSSAAASQDGEPDPTPEASQDNGNGNGNGGGGGDAANAEEVADSLAPPNGTEVSRTTSGGLVLLTYETTDSVDSLSGYYEGAISGAGLNVVSTSTAQGATNWIFESGNFSGSLTIAPSDASEGGSTVAISVLDTSV